jgi:hypothetical protein
VSWYDDDQAGAFDDEPDRLRNHLDPHDDQPDRLDDEPGDDPDDRRWPLTWRGLYPRERWLWFEQLWTDACMLRDRYRLTIRSGWWEDQIQVEALAALAAWAARYDAGDGTTHLGSWRFCSTWSGWRRCSKTATSRFIQSGTDRHSGAIWPSSAANAQVADGRTGAEPSSPPDR